MIVGACCFRAIFGDDEILEIADVQIVITRDLPKPLDELLNIRLADIKGTMGIIIRQGDKCSIGIIEEFKTETLLPLAAAEIAAEYTLATWYERIGNGRRTRDKATNGNIRRGVEHNQLLTVLGFAMTVPNSTRVETSHKSIRCRFATTKTNR